jgi:hypothetical protein
MNNIKIFLSMIVYCYLSFTSWLFAYLLKNQKLWQSHADNIVFIVSVLLLSLIIYYKKFNFLILLLTGIIPLLLMFSVLKLGLD